MLSWVWSIIDKQHGLVISAFGKNLSFFKLPTMSLIFNHRVWATAHTQC